jgi:N,N'-diacetyllegionaminate synthase
MDKKKIFLIAEIAQAHDGSLGIAHSYIEALADSGIDAIKFQVHIADAESSIHEPFRVKFSYEDTTRFDYWKRMEFTFEQWGGLKKHCEECGMEFMASPFSNEAVDLLEKLGIKRYKIGSGEVTNLLMLEKIAKTGKPVIISSGMSSYDEIDRAVDLFKRYGCEYSLLQCTTAYPSRPGQWGLNIIAEMKGKYKVTVGFSDHSGDVYASLAAAATGAEILEFHVVFDKRMFGPDATSSLTIEQVKYLADGVRQIETSLENPVNKVNTESFTGLKNMFEKTLAVNRYVKAGEKITPEILEAKKPKGHGINAGDFKEILGKTFRHDLEKWSFIKPEDIDE